MTTELFNIQAGTALQNITYKGTNESVASVIAGDVLTTIADSGPASAAIRGGKVRGLAVTSPKLMAAFPDIPTMKEVGLARIDGLVWYGLLAPAGTPKNVIAKLNAESNRVLAMQDLKDRLTASSIDTAGSTDRKSTRLNSSHRP